MSAIHIDAVVGEGGRLELAVPLPAGTAVEVLIRDPQEANEDESEFEWDDHLQERLDALDRGEVDPRPWREIIAELKARYTRTTEQ